MFMSMLRPYISRQTQLYLYNFFTLLYEKLQSFFFFFTMSQSSVPHEQQQESSTIDPPPFDPSQPSIPISYPIKTLEELASRVYFHSFHYPFNKSSAPLDPASVSLPNRPRILVCHDMQGGYGDDKWVQGGTTPDAYAIWHWYLIDVFVYFSHYLVTLPPPCWTNAAHRHGVKVLGTFITEWEEGRLICNKLLATKETAQMYAEQLAELAVDLGFDGWLINMENNLSVEQIPNLLEFVSHLTQTIHSSIPGSLVIWYDSVTNKGELKWQDQLNESNKLFFDICDGIFVNYTWKRNYPNLSASVAGDRKFDVYMGIDVFGRNTYGGGQWNTDVALNVLKKDNVSAAIFAPAWVYETEQPPDFQTAQNRWWALVEKSWGRLNNYPKQLPFYTNFDQGHGYHISVEGGQVTDAPWNNMSCQGFQPFLEFVDGPSPDTIQVAADFKNASYNGGGNITFKGILEDNDHFTTRLFRQELILGNLPIHLEYSVKSHWDSQLGIALQFSSTMNKKTSILITSGEMNQFSGKFSKVIAPRQVRRLEMASGWVVHEGRIAMNAHILTEIHAVCYRQKPEHTKLRSKHNADGQENVLACSPGEYFAVLGHISIKDSEENSYLPSSTWLVEGQHIKYSSVSGGLRTVSMKIFWKPKDGNGFLFRNYNIYVDKLAKQDDVNPGGKLESTREYLGVAQVEAFYVSNLSIASDISHLKFIVQPCSIDGAYQRLDDSPYFLLDVEG